MPRPAEEDLQMIRDELAMFLSGKMTHFDVFKGPITDNQGNLSLLKAKPAPGRPELLCQC